MYKIKITSQKYSSLFLLLPQAVAFGRLRRLRYARVCGTHRRPILYGPSTDPVRHFFSSSSVVLQCRTEELLKNY